MAQCSSQAWPLLHRQRRLTGSQSSSQGTNLCHVCIFLLTLLPTHQQAPRTVYQGGSKAEQQLMQCSSQAGTAADAMCSSGSGSGR